MKVRKSVRCQVWFLLNIPPFSRRFTYSFHLEDSALLGDGVKSLVEGLLTNVEITNRVRGRALIKNYYANVNSYLEQRKH